MNVPRPVLRWHGGKWRLAPWIIAQMPEHSVYTEAFGGAASVLLRKPRCKVEVYNDLDEEVVNLFRVLRSPRAAELVEAVRLTPWARLEFEDAYLVHSDPVDRARALVVRSFMGFGSNGHARSTGFRSRAHRQNTTPQQDWLRMPDALGAVVERFGGVVVEARDAFKVLQRYDDPAALHYVDPPYLPETRDRGSDYRAELSSERHLELLELVCGLSGRVILSGYPHPVYDRALAGWRRLERAALADGGRLRTEVLWLNFAVASPLPLFEGAA